MGGTMPPISRRWAWLPAGHEDCHNQPLRRRHGL